MALVSSHVAFASLCLCPQREQTQAVQTVLGGGRGLTQELWVQALPWPPCAVPTPSPQAGTLSSCNLRFLL